MSRSARFGIVCVTDKAMYIKDYGPWDEHPTITNDAENVVKLVYRQLEGRRLLYFDSEGELAELKIKDGKFSGFAPASGV